VGERNLDDGRAGAGEHDELRRDVPCLRDGELQCGGGACTFTEYYDVNEATITGSFGLFGQVQRTYDDNGTDTAVVQVYDAFGRVVKVVRPGDSVSIPTEIWEYSDAYSGGGCRG